MLYRPKISDFNNMSQFPPTETFITVSFYLINFYDSKINIFEYWNWNICKILCKENLEILFIKWFALKYCNTYICQLILQVTLVQDRDVITWSQSQVKDHRHISLLWLTKGAFKGPLATWAVFSKIDWMLNIKLTSSLTSDLCSQAVAAEFQNESAAALAAAATRHLQEAEQAKNSGNEHWWGHTLVCHWSDFLLLVTTTGSFFFFFCLVGPGGRSTRPACWLWVQSKPSSLRM